MTTPPHPRLPDGRVAVDPRQRRGVLFPVVVAVVIGVCGLVVLGLVGSQVGVVGVLVGAVAALVPVAVVVGAFLWIDRWEPEPSRLLLAAFGWGACVATLSALIINSTAQVVADEVLGEGTGDVVSAVVSAPLVEEAMKAAFLFFLVWRRRREFDGVVDGIVYSGLVAAGFAFTENILYFGRAFAEDGLAAGADGGVLAVFVLRGLISPFAHPLFTAMVGVGLGVAVTTRHAAVRVAAPIGGYVGAVALHATWNGSATLGGGLAFLAVYAFVMLPLFVGMIVLIVWQRRREQRTVLAALPGFAGAGWIAPSEVPLLATLAGRRGWRRAVRAEAGTDAAKAVASYQATVTELAFLRARMARGTAVDGAEHWHAELVRTLVGARAAAPPRAWRAAWPGPPPPRPARPGRPALPAPAVRHDVPPWPQPDGPTEPAWRGPGPAAPQPPHAPPPHRPQPPHQQAPHQPHDPHVPPPPPWPQPDGPRAPGAPGSPEPRGQLPWPPHQQPGPWRPSPLSGAEPYRPPPPPQD